MLRKAEQVRCVCCSKSDAISAQSWLTKHSIQRRRESKASGAAFLSTTTSSTSSPSPALIDAVVALTTPSGPKRARISRDAEEQDQAVSNVAQTLFANIRFMSVDDSVCVIAITSSIPNEGKTFVLMDLASAVAVSGISMLLVEYDMRRSSMEAHIGVHASLAFTRRWPAGSARVGCCAHSHQDSVLSGCRSVHPQTL